MKATPKLPSENDENSKLDTFAQGFGQYLDKQSRIFYVVRPQKQWRWADDELKKYLLN